MPPPALFDLSTIDIHKPIIDAAEISKSNPQRFEMQQLDGVLHVDTVANIIVGYKQVRDDEFWVRGHMPGYPLLPGVLICEASAQMCSFYAMRYGNIDCDFIGFGGLENVVFRAPVRPGDRLIFVAKTQKMHRRKMIFGVQGFVGSKMVFEGDIIGMAMMRKED